MALKYHIIEIHSIMESSVPNQKGKFWVYMTVYSYDYSKVMKLFTEEEFKVVQNKGYYIGD